MLTSRIYGAHTDDDGKCERHLYAATDQLKEPVQLISISARRLERGAF